MLPRGWSQTSRVGRPCGPAALRAASTRRAVAPC